MTLNRSISPGWQYPEPRALPVLTIPREGGEKFECLEFAPDLGHASLGPQKCFYSMLSDTKNCAYLYRLLCFILCVFDVTGAQSLATRSTEAIWVHRLIFYYEIIHGKGSRHGVFSRYSVAKARSKSFILPCLNVGVVRRPLFRIGGDE